MTDPANLITYALKELTATERDGFVDDEFLREVGGLVTLETLYDVQLGIYNLEYRKFWLSRIDPIAKVNDIDPYIPWWLECNKERFPYWFGEREPRLEQLFEAFQKPHQYNLDSFMFYE